MTTKENNRENNGIAPSSDLHARYGQIGISAVAAAVLYKAAPAEPRNGTSPARGNGQTRAVDHNG
jgi:hypothetical protein